MVTVTVTVTVTAHEPTAHDLTAFDTSVGIELVQLIAASFPCHPSVPALSPGCSVGRDRDRDRDRLADVQERLGAGKQECAPSNQAIPGCTLGPA